MVTFFLGKEKPWQIRGSKGDPVAKNENRSQDLLELGEML